MDLICDYTEMLVLLFAVMLFTNYNYPENYVLQSFWILCIPWYGVIAIANTTYTTTVFHIILIIVNVLINMFYLSETLKDLKSK